MKATDTPDHHHKPELQVSSIRRPARLVRILLSMAVASAAALVGISAGTAADAWAGAPDMVGSSWLSGHGVNVCYPVGTPCTGTTEYPGESTGGPYNWQCEELAARLWTTLGWYSAGWTQQAYQLYGGLAASQVSYHPNNGSYVPIPGDLIIHAANDHFAEGAGHVAVVDRVDPGTLTIHVVEQNVSPSYEDAPGQASYVHGSSGWTRHGSSAHPIGFVHANADHYSNTPTRGWAVVMRHNGPGGYRVAPDGTITSLGGAPPLAPSATWPGQNIVRGAVLRSDDLGGYVLDLYGGIHPFGAAPPVSVSAYWPGWDIARGLVLRSDNVSGYVVDGYGGLHPFGDAPAVSGSAYWPGWDIATGVAGYDDNGGYVLDGYGGLHPYGDAPAVSGSAYWPGWNIANGIVTTHDGFGPGGYVLDGYGGMHPFGDAPPVAVAGYHAGLDTAVAAAITPHAARGYEVDTSGTVTTVTGPTPGCLTCQ